MSPFRKYLAARGVRHPGAYSLLIVVAGMLASMVTAVIISVQASDRAIDHAIQAQHDQQAADRAASCAFIKTISDSYKTDPPKPMTDAYKAVAGAWESLAKRCERER